MLPILLTQIKMPHWPVPLYLVSAVWLAREIVQVLKLKKVKDFLVKKRLLNKIAVVAAVALSVIPYPLESRHGRGEEWVYYQHRLQSAQKELLILELGHRLYPDRAYVAMFLGHDFKHRFINRDYLSNQKNCSHDTLLWVHSQQKTKELISELRLYGWKAENAFHPNATIFYCD